MTLRAVAIALLLIPLQAFWIVHMELVRDGIFPTVLSLLFTVVFFLFVICLLNLGVRRWWPRWALRDDELLSLYILLAAGCSLGGCDVGQTLVHLLGAPYHFALPANGWGEHFHRYLPDRLLVHDPAALKDFYRGASTLYTWSHVRYWLGPGLSWLGFSAGLLVATFGLCLLVRRQWVEHERLAFPIVQVPLAMTCEAGFFRQAMLWRGFALAGGLDFLNGLHALVPAAPQIECKQVWQLGAMFTDAPWNAVGWLPLTLYPFAIGLGFLMPLEMSFSCWLGLLLWKVQRVIGATYGYPPPSFGACLAQEQLAGVWLGVVLSALWMGRRELQWVMATDEHGRELRWGIVLLLAGLAEMVAFALRVGMTAGFAVAFMGLYLAFSLALTRMRAEFGPPCHDLYGAGPDGVFLNWLGSGGIQPRNLTAMAVFFWLGRESARSHPMPPQLEALYLSAGRIDRRRLAIAVVLAGCLSLVVTFWATLHFAYAVGSEGGFRGPATWFATEGYRRLDQQLLNPARPTVGGRLAMVLAFAATVGALQLRTRLLWFTFHPAGYAISSWWAIHLLWFPLLLAWGLKGCLLRYGGQRLYRAWRPFFCGLILGEFVVGSVWQLAGLLGGFTAYAFWI